MTFGMYGTLFLLPLTWQSSGRFNATQAGIALMPMALIFVLFSSLSGAMLARYGTRIMTAGGVTIIGCGLVLIGLSAHQASIVLAEVGLVLTGLGMGLATGPLMGAAMGAVDAARSGTAASLINVARMAGATIGIAVLGAIFDIAHGGAQGLRLAMLAGGSVQIACAIAAYFTTRPSAMAASR
jgi:DHA2 family methylenomycin A resistance protein-like MFS transporter